MKSTVPADTLRSDADERANNYTHHELSPLTRAALMCGVAFDDAYEYALACARACERPIDMPEELAAYADRRLDEALEASQVHMHEALSRPAATLPASRLWWQGVL